VIAKNDRLKLLPHAVEFLSGIPEPRTAQTYGYALGVWEKFLVNKKSVKADDVSTWTNVLLADYHTWLVNRGYVMSSVSLYIAAVNRYLQYLDAHDLLPFSLDKAVNKWVNVRGGRRYNAQSKSRTADPRIPQIITYYDNLELPDGDDYKSWLKRIRILRARAVVHTLYASAGRASEICDMTREKVRDGRLSQCKVVGKGKKDRLLLLTPESQKAIAAYCKERDDSYPALFISHGRGAGNPLTRSTVWAIVRDAAKELKLEGFASPHAFRHFRAQSLLDSGMDIATLQAYLGHEDMNLTRRVYAPDTPLSKIQLQLNQFGIDAQTAAKNSEGKTA
jgi:site-specific recombinase XerD